MATTAEYDLVVIGAGPGGYVAGIRAAQLGLRTVVIERDQDLGGTCLLRGCIPTKALLENAHVYQLVQHAKEFGVSATGVALDLATVHSRKERVVKKNAKGIEFLFKKNGVERVKGTGRLVRGGRVHVTGEEGEREVAAREIVIATGSQPGSVTGITLDRKRVITSDEALLLPEVPKSLLILGAGAVGVEFASIYARFGSKVTLVELLPRLVPLEDEAVSADLEKAFRRQGIAVKTGARAGDLKVSASEVELTAEVGDGKRETLTADYLLVATGRGPVTDGLGAEDVGLKMTKGFVEVDAYMRTSVKGISAIGDVVMVGGRPHPQLAHVASAEGVLVAERAAGQEVRPLNYDQVPACTFCTPEIGSIGLSERAAKERGHDVRIGTFPFTASGRAAILGETEGFVKIVAHRRYDELLGVHIIGPHATELIAEAGMALRLESTVEELIRTIHAHPTLAEATHEAAEAVHGASIHF